MYVHDSVKVQCITWEWWGHKLYLSVRLMYSRQWSWPLMYISTLWLCKEACQMFPVRKRSVFVRTWIEHGEMWLLNPIGTHYLHHVELGYWQLPDVRHMVRGQGDYFKVCGLFFIFFIFHVLQLLPIRFTLWNLSCINKLTFKHQQKSDWKCSRGY